MFEELEVIIDSIRKQITAFSMSTDVSITPQNAPVAPVLPVTPPTMHVTNEMLCAKAKSLMGRHLTLNPVVPPELGCAECWSLIARESDLPIPNGGFAGTPAIANFIRTSGLFVQVQTPKAGTTVLAETGTSTKNDPHGHVGIMDADGWIMSNDSDTGLLAKKYTNALWIKYFSTALGFPTTYWDLK